MTESGEVVWLKNLIDMGSGTVVSLSKNLLVTESDDHELCLLKNLIEMALVNKCDQDNIAID